MTDLDELVRAFEDLSLPVERFHHREHCQVAYRYLQGRGLLGALEAFPAALKRFACAKGVSRVYHETVTWAFLLLLNERLERMGRATSWEDFAAANPDLLQKGCLARHYSDELLASPLARRVFVLPDRA
jgi:hypothetical protein